MKSIFIFILNKLVALSIELSKPKLMRSKFLLLAALLLSVIFHQCSFNGQKKSSLVTKLAANEEEEQDGIREAQKMEFEMTKDPALGYIPKDRLIKATNDLYQARMSGNYVARINALSWLERGPYLDLKGPGGNGRGTIGNPTLSGRIRSLWVDLKDATNHTVWVGSASGGLWKTNDVTAGPPTTWTAVNDLLGNLAIMTICQDPTGTKDIMYIGTGEKTFNSGAVRGGGIWKSTNNGATWSLLASTTGFNNVSKIVVDASGNVYAATIGSGILRSTNGGTSWTNISPAGLSNNIIDMNLSTTGRLHIACGYYSSASISGPRYTDIPATVNNAGWTSPATSYSPVGNNVAFASNGNTLYATLDNGAGQTAQVWKSTDGGANWSATPTTPTVTGQAALSSGQAWYCEGITVDPSNANNVMVGGLNTYITKDGGATWTINSGWVTGIPGTSQYIHADHQTFLWSTGNQILCGGDGGLFYSSNGGTSFSDRNQGIRIKQFYSCAIHPTSTNYFLAGAQDNGVHQLNGAGLASSLEVTGGDGGFVHIDENEPNIQFGSYTRSQYRRSTDGGASFSSFNFSSSAGQFINPTDYDDMNNNFYGGWSAGFYTQWLNAPVNGINTPVAVAAFGGGQVTHVSVSHYTPNRIFFGLGNGKIVKVDNANTGTPLATDITGSGMGSNYVTCVASGTKDNNLLSTVSNYGVPHVWVSTTGGGTGGWTDISGNLPDIPVRWAMFNPEDNTKAIIATEAGIFETALINGGATVWVQNSAFPTVRTDMFQYRYSDNTILAATYGRGLWTSSFTPVAPYVRFASSYTYSPLNAETTTTSVGVCRNYKDYTLNMHIDKAPAGAAAVTLSIAGGATATQGVDFDFTTNGNFAAPSSVVTFPNGGTADQPITVRVYDDAEIEGNESFTLNYSVGGGTDAIAAPSSQSYTFNIGDNDATPVVSTYSGNFTIGTLTSPLFGESAFRGDIVKNRSQHLYTKAELNAAGITGAGNITSMVVKVTNKTSTLPYNGFTISMGNTTTTDMQFGFANASLSQVYSGNYSTVAGDNTFNFTTPFAWDGTSNIIVNFCFDNGAATSGLDQMEAATTPAGATRGSSWSNVADPGPGCSLNAAFVGTNRIRATFGASAGNPIETILNNNRSEFIPNNGAYYFYNGSNILSSLSNASASLGCVSSNIFEAGTTWQSFAVGQRSQKVFEITPTTNSGTSYTVGIYYTLAELAGKTPSTLKIAKTNAATMAAANGSNTISAATTVTAFGTGYLFTANFTGFSKFFLIDPAVVLPVQLISFSGLLNSQEHSQLQWRTTNQLNFDHFEVQRSYDGVQFTPAGTVRAIQNNVAMQDYTFTDPLIAKAINFYQLKMVDIDGRSKLSPIIRINNVKTANFVQLLQNPVKDYISILLNNSSKENVTAELFNRSGQLISKSNLGKVDGNVVLPLNASVLASGVYVLRITAGTQTGNVQVTKL